LIHFPHWNVPFFLRTPFVVTIHDLILLDEPYSSKISTRHKAIFALKYWGYKRVLSRAIFRSKKIIAVSQATANAIKKHFPNVDRQKIQIIYEGVTSFPTLPYSSPTLPQLFPTLLYFGNAYPHKNLDKLLKAFLILRSKHLDCRLVLAGRDDLFYKKLLEKKPVDVEFVPNPSDEKIQSLLKQTTIFVFPSRIEGFGLPPLEAMSAGVPVAVSDIPSLREILGDAAAYFNPSSAQSLASVLSDLLVSSGKQTFLIQKGFAQIQKYSWQTMTHEIISLYKSSNR
jgi:glycosyltransferase involved in cell wall biosynthesis